jgi:photosystem I P700 chlorophyll a apoprotein A1
MVPKRESMMNHHLAGLLGLGCLSWSGHQIALYQLINYWMQV